jgi:transcriptional regulator with XRE-family HTH domain
MTAERARLEALRSHLGAQLAAYRTAAVVSQPQLGQALGRTRSTVSKIEHGTRGMSAPLWTIADDLCGAGGVLVAEYEVLVAAERDYRDRCRSQRRQMQIQQAGAQARRQALSAWPEPGSSPGVLDGSGVDARPDTALVGAAGLAEELLHVVTRLVQMLGRREAIRTVGSVLAAVGLSGLDPDEHTRLAQALACPSRVDAQVVNNLAGVLAYCKRLEDKLGPSEVMDTVLAQYRLVRRLVEGGCPSNLVKPLRLVESNTASTIGIGLINMGQPEVASRYFQRARHAAHEAGNPACAAYAAASTSRAAFQRGDTPAALDSAAAARSLAARTGDPRLKAWAEQMAAAYALEGQYGPFLAACARAQEFLASSNGLTCESPAYWVHEGALDSQRSLLLGLLGKPHDALEAALTAQARFDCTYVGGYAHCQIRLGHALVLSRDISEAARVLGDAARYASLSPRLTHELHATRALIQPWQGTLAVTTLDAQLEACGLLPTTYAESGTVIHPDRRI